MKDLESGILNVWGGGQLMGFSALDGNTDYEQGLTGQTAWDRVGIDFRIPGECHLAFSRQVPEKLFLSGDFLVMSTGGKSVRGAFTDSHHFLLEGDCDIINRSAEIQVIREGQKVLLGSASHFNRNWLDADLDTIIELRERWLHAVAVPEGLPPLTRRALYKALSTMKTQVFSPEGIIRHRWTTPDRWPHRNMWLWDSAFHAIGWRHLDAGLAREMISAVLDTRLEDGFIPLSASPFQRSHVTQPPILAMAVAAIHAVDPCLGWIEEILPLLSAYIQWDIKNRDSDGNGLLEWKTVSVTNCRSGESGMDNSPRFDVDSPLDAVDFNSYIARECELMAGFCHELERYSEEKTWCSLHEKFCSLINHHLWSEEKGLYLDRDTTSNRHNPVLAGSGFLPLLCGAPSMKQAKRLAAHITDPLTFGTPFPVPSIAAADTRHYAKDMWRGATWINLNWMIAKGFDRYGLSDVAEAIRNRTMEELQQVYEKYGTFFEFYDDRKEVDPPELLRKGECSPQGFHQAFSDYGWSATLYSDMVYAKYDSKGD